MAPIRTKIRGKDSGTKTPKTADSVSELTGIPESKLQITNAELRKQESIDDVNFTKTIERRRTPQSDDAAKRHISIAKQHEPTITADVTSICTQSGGNMCGLDFRLKSPKSLSGKIESDYQEKHAHDRDEAQTKSDWTYEDSAKGIRDNVRYTSVCEADKLANHVDSVLSSFQKKGYLITKCKNTFKDGEEYKGVNCNLKTPDGYEFELQFHTPESINAKEQLVNKGGKWVQGDDSEKLSKYPSHKYYEEKRAGTTDEKRAAYLKNKLQELWTQVKNPEGLEKVRPKYSKK